MMGSLNSLYKYAKGESSTSHNKKEKDLNIINDERSDPSMSLSEPNYVNFDIYEYLH